MNARKHGSNGALIRLAGVGRRWGRRTVLDDVDLQVAAGERLAIIGPSGGGKSTLLGLVAGSLAPSNGKVIVDGQAMADFSPRRMHQHRAKCGIVPQGSQLVPQLTAHRNVLGGLLPHWPWHRIALSALWPVDRERVRSILEGVRLADRQWDLVSNLSGGEQQRIAVARGLIGHPEIVLADEPTASLDPKNAQLVADVLLDQSHSRGATLLFCTHWVSLVREAVDRLLGVREGRIVIDAPPDDVSDADFDDLYAGSDERR